MLKRRWILVDIQYGKATMMIMSPELDLTMLQDSAQQEKKRFFLERSGDRQLIKIADSNFYFEVVRLSADTLEIEFHHNDRAKHTDDLLMTTQYIPLPGHIQEERIFVFYLVKEIKNKQNIPIRTTLELPLIISKLGYAGVVEAKTVQELLAQNAINQLIDDKKDFHWNDHFVEKTYRWLKENLPDKKESSLKPESSSIRLLEILEKAVVLKSGLSARVNKL